MLELGKNSRKFHYNLGKKLSGYGIDILVTVGKLTKFLAKGAISQNLNAKMIFSFDSTVKAENKLISIINSGDVVLVKGSRLFKMERIVERIKNHFSQR